MDAEHDPNKQLQPKVTEDPEALQKRAAAEAAEKELVKKLEDFKVYFSSNCSVMVMVMVMMKPFLFFFCLFPSTLVNVSRTIPPHLATRRA